MEESEEDLDVLLRLLSLLSHSESPVGANEDNKWGSPGTQGAFLTCLVIKLAHISLSWLSTVVVGCVRRLMLNSCNTVSKVSAACAVFGNIGVLCEFH